MAQATRTAEVVRETIIVKPAVEAVTREVTTEVATFTLTLTQDEADSLATLLHCHVGGLQRSPSLQAIFRVLEGTEGVNMNARELVARDPSHSGLSVLADLFGMDKRL